MMNLTATEIAEKSASFEADLADLQFKHAEAAEKSQGKTAMVLENGMETPHTGATCVWCVSCEG